MSVIKTDANLCRLEKSDAMAVNLLGSHISLISKKDIRYEGTLSHIDAENSCVTLDNVKSWGTEGRVPKDAEFEAEAMLHGSVEFRGQDIKDLQVHRTPQTIIPPSQTPPQQRTASTHAVKSPSTAPSTTVEEPTSGPAAAEESKPESESGPTSHPAPRTRARKYRPPHKKKQNREPHEGHRNKAGGNNAPSMVVSKEDFDIQGALAEFEKDAEMAKFFKEGEELGLDQGIGNEGGGGGGGDASENGSGPAVVAKKYDKNSFFDELSCEALCGRTKTTRQKEKQLNTETFGEAGESYRGYPYRRRGGGRGSWRSTRGGQRSRSHNIHQPSSHRNPGAAATGSDNQQSKS